MYDGNDSAQSSNGGGGGMLPSSALAALQQQLGAQNQHPHQQQQQQSESSDPPDLATLLMQLNGNARNLAPVPAPPPPPPANNNLLGFHLGNVLQGLAAVTAAGVGNNGQQQIGANTGLNLALLQQLGLLSSGGSGQPQQYHQHQQQTSNNNILYQLNHLLQQPNNGGGASFGNFTHNSNTRELYNGSNSNTSSVASSLHSVANQLQHQEQQAAPAAKDVAPNKGVASAAARPERAKSSSGEESSSQVDTGVILPILTGVKCAPGSVAVPCRARGMPMDHNPLTAYHIISENIKHGDDVVCSHAGCRDGGIKFRYCSHCKAPVAKRNFRRRHNHGDNDATFSDDDDDAEEVGHTKGPKQTKTRFREEPSSSSSSNGALPPPATKKVRTMTNGAARSTTPSSSEPSVVSADETVTKSSGAKRATSTDDKKPSSSKVHETRRLMWAALLDDRPPTEATEPMSQWIHKVLLVSDKEQPILPPSP